MQCVSIATGMPLMQMITGGLYLATSTLQISNVYAYNKIAKNQQQQKSESIINKPHNINENKVKNNVLEKEITNERINSIEEEIQNLEELKTNLIVKNEIETPKIKIKKRD